MNCIKSLALPLTLDYAGIAVKALLNQIPSPYTEYKEVLKSQAATHLHITKNDHQVTNYWWYGSLIENNLKSDSTVPFDELAFTFKNNFKLYNQHHEPDCHAITLTGGKDSRSGLAALFNLGIKPYTFTYGCSQSRDSVYARRLAQEMSIHHYIFSPPDKSAYFNEMTAEILSYGNPSISIHRAHRLYAFKEMSNRLQGSKAYYAGYMAGEFLMGVYYDNLIFTNYLTDFWKFSRHSSIESVLLFNFIKLEKGMTDEVLDRLDKLRCFNSQLSLMERQFFGLFELGISHHAQDVFLASKYFDFVYPFFVDIDLLTLIFQSNYNFFHVNNKTKNVFSRYELYKFNLYLQHDLCPQMDTIPFGKRGSYTTAEFLKGRYYWAVKKGLRYLFQNNHYAANYAYSNSFYSFLNTSLLDLKKDPNHILHKYYDIPAAIESLGRISGKCKESDLHCFSNIFMLFSQMQNKQIGC